jgi:ribonuclease HI
MKPDRKSVLEALADTLDVDGVLKAFPGLEEEDLRAMIRGAASAENARPVKKGRLVAYVDGAARGNPGEAGAGIVLKDSAGGVVEKIALYLGKATNNMAEYEALIHALRRAGELQASSLQVFSDSELLVHQINGRYRVRAPHLQKLCQEAIRLMRDIGDVNISHISREKNAEADEQANRAIDQSLKR